MFSYAPEIWAAFPELAAGVLRVEPLDAAPAQLLPSLHARARARLAAGPEGDFPEIQAWRRAFAKLGLKPTQYRCASEALLRRLRQTGEIPSIHPLIDFCNAVSLATALPVAIFDLAQIEGDLTVRFAEGDERYETFSGDVEIPAKGEVIFADAARHAHARRWCHRQSRRSALGTTSGTALIVVEALHTGAAADVQGALTRLAEGFRQAEAALLTAENGPDRF